MKTRIARKHLKQVIIGPMDRRHRACKDPTAFDLIEVPIFALRKIVEKEIERSNATAPGDDKIGSRVSWWFAGSTRYPSNPSGIT
jgi:hypothetical protein